MTAQITSGLGYDPMNARQQPEEARQDYTGYQKDEESGLEYAQARYYNSSHGRFTSVDPLTASASIRDPQTFNRYSYVLNSPYKFTDPLGLLPLGSGACGQWCSNSGPSVDGSAFRGTDTSFDWAKPKADPPEPPPPPPPTTIKLANDKIINKKIKEINEKAKPLASGVTPVVSDIIYIEGEQRNIQGTTNFVAPDGDMKVLNGNGYGQTIGVVILDQGGNIIYDPKYPDNFSFVENLTAVSPDAKMLEKLGRIITSNRQSIYQQSNGVFYDLQYGTVGKTSYYIEVNQNVTIRQFIPSANVERGVIQIQGIKIVRDDSKKTITITQGRVVK